jgi:hypothetical protein
MSLTGFFLLETAWRAGAVALVVLVMAKASQAVVFHRRFLPAIEGKAPVGAFFSSVTALFALFVAFAAADAWSRGDRATEALGQEARALAAFHAASQVLGEEAAPLRSVFSAYLGASLRDEWGVSRNTEPSAAAAETLHRLEDASLAGLRRGAEGAGGSAALWSELLQRAHDLRAARDTRLRFGKDFGQPWKWVGLLLLTLSSQVAIAFVHLDRRRTAAVAQAIFGTAAATALSIVAGFEGPYGGIGAVQPTSLLMMHTATAAAL